MIAALKSLFALLFAVSLLCGTAAMAHGVPMDGAHAMTMTPTDAHDCGACDDPADMACAAMAAHCAPAITAHGGGAIIDRAALRVGHALPADLALIGAGPEFDTPLREAEASFTATAARMSPCTERPFRSLRIL